MATDHNNMTRRGAVYHFRRRVPHDIIDRVNKQEITKSLGTADHTQAKRRAKRAGVASDDAFEAVRAAPDLSPEEVHRLLLQYFEEALAEDEEQRARSKPHQPVYTSLPPGDLDTDPVEADLEVLGSALEETKQSLATNELRSVRRDVATLVEAAGLRPVSPDSAAFQGLARGILRAQIEALKLAMARRVGNYAKVPADPLFRDTAKAHMEAAPQEAPEEGPLLSAVIAEYAAEKLTEGAWEAGKTRQVYLERFVIEAPRGRFVRFLNRNTLDCRRANLAVVEYRRDTFLSDSVQRNSPPLQPSVPPSGSSKGDTLHRTYQVRSPPEVEQTVEPEEEPSVFAVAALPQNYKMFKI